MLEKFRHPIAAASTLLVLGCTPVKDTSMFPQSADLHERDLYKQLSPYEQEKAGRIGLEALQILSGNCKKAMAWLDEPQTIQEPALPGITDDHKKEKVIEVPQVIFECVLYKRPIPQEPAPPKITPIRQ